MTQDAQGHHLSGATEAAVTVYDAAVRAFNLVHGDAIGLFDTARQAAPDFAMAHLGKAWVFTVANDPGLRTQAAALVETARPLTLNEREQAHLAALSHLVQRSRAAAVAVLDRHLMHYPFDLVAHQGAALTDGFLGASIGSAIGRRGPCRCGPGTSRATEPCWPCTASGWRKPAITPAPRTNRAPPPN